ncbi:MAG: Spy/CpxP family protein refolding chaperone [Acetobacter sp.]|jgi:protein CpxP|nr:Spy/CpxP family protein refolding chaperone [Acetobacter sp.]
MKRSLFALVPVVALAIGGGATVAHGHSFGPGAPPPMDGHGGPGGMGMMPFFHGLDLTKKQKAQISEIMKEAHKNRPADHGADRDLHDKIAELLLAPGKVDEAQLAALMKQEDDLRQQAEQDRMQIAVKIHNVLTDEQLAQAKARFTKMQSLQAEMRDLMKPSADEKPNDAP